MKDTYIFNNKEIYITHFHPLMEELYKQLKEVNNGINILVVKKQFLDLMQGCFWINVLHLMNQNIEIEKNILFINSKYYVWDILYLM